MTTTKRGSALAWLLASLVCGTSISVAQQVGPQAPSQSGSPAKKATAAKAKQSKSAPDEGKVDAAAAQTHVEDGINALNAGKTDVAVASLTTALSSATLPPAQTARALYYRGIAYRKQAKPALAIADLTSALWLKGGLDERQRQDAIQNRAAAYREAGLSDQSEADYARSASVALAILGAGATTSASAVTTQSIATAPVVQPPRATTAGVGAKAIDRLPEATAETFPLRSSSARANQPEPQQEAPPPRQTSSTTSGIGGLFGSLVGGGQSPAPEPAKTASPATGAWSTSTQVNGPSRVAAASAPALSEQRVAVAQLPAASAPKTAAGAATRPSSVGTTAALPPASPGGNYRVQVAAVRTNEEALSIAAQLQDRYGRELGNRSASVDQTVMGNIGTIYRVRIGPFANSNESRSLCVRLQSDGFDCMIVTVAQ